MKTILIITLLIVFVSLQISLAPIISIKDITPQLIFIFVFFASFTLGQTSGIWVGFFSGFLCDIFDVTHFGLNMGLLLIAGFVIGTMKPKFYRDNLLVDILFFAVALFLYETIYLILLWQFSLGTFLLNILRYSIPSVLYTTIISLFVFTLLKRIPYFVQSH
jgi:rod shape-determining protein MreD